MGNCSAKENSDANFGNSDANFGNLAFMMALLAQIWAPYQFGRTQDWKLANGGGPLTQQMVLIHSSLSLPKQD